MIETLTYKDKPILRIKKDNSFVKIQFGTVKAQMILDNIDAIQLFVRDNAPSQKKVTILESGYAAPTHIIEPSLAGEVVV